VLTQSIAFDQASSEPVLEKASQTGHFHHSKEHSNPHKLYLTGVIPVFVVLCLECRAMEDMGGRVVAVEVAGNKQVRRVLGWQGRHDFRPTQWLHHAK
jgi:hypothetical protein